MERKQDGHDVNFCRKHSNWLQIAQAKFQEKKQINRKNIYTNHIFNCCNQLGKERKKTEKQRMGQTRHFGEGTLWTQHREGWCWPTIEQEIRRIRGKVQMGVDVPKGRFVYLLSLY